MLWCEQVAADFEVYGKSHGLNTCCVHGGSPYGAQEVSLRRGVDIVFGILGRIKDHIERGNLDFGSLQFHVLDDADEMLDMGFLDDVELIISWAPGFMLKVSWLLKFHCAHMLTAFSIWYHWKC